MFFNCYTFFFYITHLFNIYFTIYNITACMTQFSLLMFRIRIRDHIRKLLRFILVKFIIIRGENFYELNNLIIE